MSVTNDFLPFAIGGGANVESQSDYLADALRGTGNQPGVASSAFNNKAFRQANVVGSQLAQLVSDTLNDNVVDNGVVAQLLAQMKAAILPIAPIYTKFTGSSGTWNATFFFFIASGNATSGATYTNNSVTFTVVSTITAGTLLKATGNSAPLVSGTLTKTGGSGDATISFYAVRAPVLLKVKAVGAGGGGGGGGTVATDGTNTTFGSSLLTCGGGTHGIQSQTAGSGGTVTIGGGAGTSGISFNGADGVPGGAAASITGGPGGASIYGGAGSPGQVGSPGNPAQTNSGSGGGGGQTTSNGSGGGGSGAGVDWNLFSPAFTYPWAVGAKGTGATGSGSNLGGGNGADGLIELWACYQ